MRKKARSDSKLSYLRRGAGPLFCVLALFYLGFHAVSGERGLFALFKETRKLERVQAELNDIVSQREALDHKVKLMSSSSLDLDMLDEQVRSVLGLTGKNEVVYFLDSK